MTKLFFRISIFSMLLSTLFMTSCEDGPTIPGTGTGVTPPSVSSSVSTDVDLDAGSDFTTTINASQGDALLRDIEIFENGSRLSTDRLIVNGTQAAANPILIVLDADKASFSYEFTITDIPAGVNNYEFAVTDDDGESNSTSINVTGLSEPLSIVLDQGNTFDGATPDATISVPITAVAGSNALASISVTENGVLMEADRLALGDNDFDNNPYTLSDDDANGFQKNLFIEVAGGSNDYTITLTDDQDDKVSTTLTVNAGTNLTGEFSAVILNNNAGQNEGGLDLYNGVAVSTASNFDAAQVVDQGINNNLPLAENWLQEVAPVNGATLRRPGADQPEGFSFENVDSREAIVAAYNTGSDGDDMDASGKLAEGDLLIVQSGDDYFLLRIAEISVTADNNNDFYRIDIKQSIQ